MINGRKQKDGFVCGPDTAVFSKLCVAVKVTDDAVMVRDTKDPNDTTLTFNHQEWQIFVKAIKDGEFNV